MTANNFHHQRPQPEPSVKASSDALGHFTFQHHPTPSPPTPTPPCPDRGVFCFVIRALEQLPDNTLYCNTV